MALRHKDGTVDKGVSLARGPALVMGTILTAFGLILLLKNGETPTGGFTDGTADGDRFLGFETNGWTAFFTITAGALLLFGAAQHLLAKTMCLLVGLALGACSVIALSDGDDVLGLAAANGWTKLGWGAAAAVLLVTALLPRKGRKHADDHVAHREPVVAPRPAVRREEAPAARERVGEDRTRVEGGAGEPRTGRFDRDGTPDTRVREGGSVADDSLRR